MAEATAPVRLVHLGLGAFHRAHQAWYTHLANQLDGAEPYGIWAFTGRRPDAAKILAAQDCRYTLIERSAEGDQATMINSIVRASDGADAQAWRAAMSDGNVAALTLTITEAGYRTDDGDLDRLRDGTHPNSAPGRIVDGLRARRQTSGAPIAIISCDNLSGNGTFTHDTIVRLARQLDPGLAEWIEAQVSFVSTMIDRITPATTAADLETAQQLTGWPDQSPVVAEPFSEWVISGDFPNSRPAWERVGVSVVDDVEPHEQRKLWLLNGGHSLLAYTGLAVGHTTIAETMADAFCVELLEAHWSEAAEVLPFDQQQIEAATAALHDRFSNARIQHQLSQIAADGFHKLPLRIVDVQRARQAGGLPFGIGGLTAIAAWVIHLEGDKVKDQAAWKVMSKINSARSATDKVRAALQAIAPELSDDTDVINIVTGQLDLIHRRAAETLR